MGSSHKQMTPICRRQGTQLRGGDGQGGSEERPETPELWFQITTSAWGIFSQDLEDPGSRGHLWNLLVNNANALRNAPYMRCAPPFPIPHERWYQSEHKPTIKVKCGCSGYFENVISTVNLTSRQTGFLVVSKLATDSLLSPHFPRLEVRCSAKWDALVCSSNDSLGIQMDPVWRDTARAFSLKRKGWMITSLTQCLFKTWRKKAQH